MGMPSLHLLAAAASQGGSPETLVPAEYPRSRFVPYAEAKRTSVISMLREHLSSYDADRECGAPTHADAELIQHGATHEGPFVRAGRPILWTHVHKVAGTSICELAKNNSEHMRGQGALSCNLCVDNSRVCQTQQTQRPMPALCADGTPGECTFRGSISCTERRGMKAASSFMAQERFVDDQACADDLVHGIMLREPVDRLISNTAYAQSRGWNASAEEVLALVVPGGAPWTPGGSCTARHCPIIEQTSFAYDNMYVRTLLGSSAMELPIGGVTRDHLAAAKARLSTYAVVLLLSEFEAQSVQLLDRFGWEYSALGRDPNPPDSTPPWEFNDEQLEQLAVANALDYELYCFATHLAAARTSESERAGGATVGPVLR